MKPVQMILLLTACRNEVKTPVVSDTAEVVLLDSDGDGYFQDEDCDDSDSSIYPNAPEICDGVDNNCNSEVDEGVALTLYVDSDGDGFGDSSKEVEACAASDGIVPNGNDCDDSNDTVFPSAPERCDNLDNDCDGEVDESVFATWYRDADGDGFGTVNDVIEGCYEDGYIDQAGDCDDSNASISPDSEEICDEFDNDCDGDIDEGLLITVYVDADSDGYGDDASLIEVCSVEPGMATIGGDCDDINSEINPDAIEVCDEDDLDEDCNGVADGADAVGAVQWYRDLDNDQYGDANDSIWHCDEQVGYVANDLDCGPSNGAQYPGADEICYNSLDDDCDGVPDSQEVGAIGSIAYYPDTDQDGFGANTTPIFYCQAQPQTSVNNFDCDDTDATVYLGATELCDGQVNACGNVLNASEADADGDGYVVCSIDSNGWDGTNTVIGDGDCNDADAATYPQAPQICDGVDNTCTTSVPADEIDNDGDGYVECTVTTPWSGIIGGGDCDDTLSSISPNAPELCDGIANVCGSSLSNTEIDNDGDGYVECTVTTPWSGITGGGDCDDTSASVRPNATELCDGIANACGTTLSNTEIDNDGDGYVECTVTTPWSGITGGGDCNDADSSTYPQAPQICDGVDNTCTTSVPADEIDNDGDGYVECTVTTPWSGIVGGGDCNDTSDNTAPNIAYMETNSTLCMTDIDGDGFGSMFPNVGSAGTDCDDSDASLNPHLGTCAEGLSCKDILDNGGSQGSGVYLIDPDGAAQGVGPFEVYCDMTPGDAGWTEIPYASDLVFQRHFTGGDAFRWLPNDFSLELSDAQISALRSISTEGKQDYVGLCNHVIHHFYNSSSNYVYAFGFELHDGTLMTGGVSMSTYSFVSVTQDGCAGNGGEGGALNKATIFSFDTTAVPVINVRSRDSGDAGEQFGSPLTANSAWLR